MHNYLKKIGYLLITAAWMLTVFCGAAFAAEEDETPRILGQDMILPGSVQTEILEVKQTGSGVRITWEAVPGAGRYYVWRAENGTWKELGTSAATSYTDKKEVLRKQYRYAVFTAEISADLTEGDGTEFTVTQFRDVLDPPVYYYKPVYWAISGNITNGFSSNLFKPDESCTRGQMMLFLWRAAGRPEPGSYENPFADVSASDTCYKAVLWAVEKGITNGAVDPATKKLIFKTNDTCTRADAVTFLWRYAGRPAVPAGNPFKDVVSSKYYYKPILWAASNDIVKGYGAAPNLYFKPLQECTRGHIMTFLYRYAVK